MPLGLQSKLLRVLQENEVEPLGSNKVIRIDVRIIAATSRDLRADVAAGRFRADLFYRLNVLTIDLPPLRERTEDMGVLCDHILEQIAARSRLPLRELDPEALSLLKRSPWPGNIRELRNALEQACMQVDGTQLKADDLRRIVTAANGSAAPPAAAEAAAVRYDEALRAFERNLIRQTLADCEGKVTEAARRLGIGRATLYKKIAALGL